MSLPRPRVRLRCRGRSKKPSVAGRLRAAGVSAAREGSLLPEHARVARAFAGANAVAWAVLEDRNIVLCAVLGILLVSYLVVCWAFMPLYLTQVRKYDPETMGWLMGTLGISATIASSAIPRCRIALGGGW